MSVKLLSDRNRSVELGNTNALVSHRTENKRVQLIAAITVILGPKETDRPQRYSALSQGSRKQICRREDIRDVILYIWVARQSELAGCDQKNHSVCQLNHKSNPHRTCAAEQFSITVLSDDGLTTTHQMKYHYTTNYMVRASSIPQIVTVLSHQISP